MASKFNLKIENAVLTFRNFAGEDRNGVRSNGRRSFAVYLDGLDRTGKMFENPEDMPMYKYGGKILTPEELYSALTEDKWNVRFWPKEEVVNEDGTVRTPRPFITVNVKFAPEGSPRAYYNPQLVMAREDGGLTPYGEEGAAVFDTVWIKTANVIIRPYNYQERDGIFDGKVSADLYKLFVVPVEDDMDDDDDFYEGYRH